MEGLLICRGEAEEVGVTAMDDVVALAATNLRVKKSEKDKKEISPTRAHLRVTVLFPPSAGPGCIPGSAELLPLYGIYFSGALWRRRRGPHGKHAQSQNRQGGSEKDSKHAGCSKECVKRMTGAQRGAWLYSDEKGDGKENL